MNTIESKLTEKEYKDLKDCIYSLIELSLKDVEENYGATSNPLNEHGAYNNVMDAIECEMNEKFISNEDYLKDALQMLLSSSTRVSNEISDMGDNSIEDEDLDNSINNAAMLLNYVTDPSSELPTFFKSKI